MKFNIKERYFSNLPSNILSGLTTGIVALPMALAFGVASGLGAEAGLYGAMATGIFAALFGGTAGQVTGPTGPMTVVTATLVAGHLKNPEYIFAAVIFAGFFQILFGFIKTGQLVRYVPYPVISGFMTGIGVIITIIQIHPLFGLKGYGDVDIALLHMSDIFEGFNLNAFFIGLFSISIIYIFPFITKKIPPPLVALIICSLTTNYFKLEIPSIGEIHHGFPTPKIPLIPLEEIHLIFPSAFALALLGSIDSLLTSLVVEKITGNRHDSDQEQIGQGIGNIAAGLIGGIPGAGATMRSLVNIKSGGTSYLGGILHGLFLLLVLISIGPIVSHVPLSCLAGILITVGIGILDYKGLKSIGKASKEDVIVMLITLSLTIFVDLIIAVAAGIALASILFTKKLSDLNLPTHSAFTIEHLYEIAEHIPIDVRRKIYTYTFNGPLFFGEVKNFELALLKMDDAKYIILIFQNVALIDQSGAYALDDALEQFMKKGVNIFFIGITKEIKSTLEKLGSLNKIDSKDCFDTLDKAIENIKS